MKNIRSFSAVIVAMIICLTLASCGSSTIKGDAVSYSNADKSFSIDLPTSSEDDWVINENTAGNVLDISNDDKNININVQCLSKSQASLIAEDLSSYEEYYTTTILSELYSDMKLKDAKIDGPEFATTSEAYSFTLKKGGSNLKGALVFMESSDCYYSYLIMAVDKAYDGNKSKLMDSIISLKEINSVPDQSSDTDNE